MDLEEFQDHLGYTFRDITLLKTALARGATHEPELALALEHMGDAAISLVIREFITRRNLRRDAQLYSVLVSNDTMITAARRIRVQEASFGFKHFQYHLTSKTVANLLEAVIGAVFHDSGIDAVREIVLRIFPLQAVLVHKENPCRIQKDATAKRMLKRYKDKKSLLKQAYRLSPYKASIDYHLERLRAEDVDFSAGSLLYEIQMAERWPMFFQPNTVVEQVNLVYGHQRSIENSFASL